MRLARPLLWMIGLAACRQGSPATPDAPPTPPVASAQTAEPEPVETTPPPSRATAPSGPVWPTGAPDPQTNCPGFLDPDSRPAFDECSVSEAFFTYAALCPGGDTNCMRPCRADVYFVDRDDRKANVYRYRYEDGHLVERTREHPFDMGADGTVSRTERFVYEDGRLMKVVVFDDVIGDVPSGETRYQWSEDGRVSGYEYWQQLLKELEPAGLRRALRVAFKRNAKGQVVAKKSVFEGLQSETLHEVEMRYQYDARGRLALAENGMYEFRYDYDGDELRPSGESSRPTGGEWVVTTRYSWNASGQLEREELPSTKEGDTYEYDAAGRLVAHHPIPADELSRRIYRYSYECP